MSWVKITTVPASQSAKWSGVTMSSSGTKIYATVEETTTNATMGVYRSVNGGNLTISYAGFANSTIAYPFISRSNDNYCYAIINGSAAAGMFRTLTNGTSWSRIATSLRFNDKQLMQVAFGGGTGLNGVTVGNDSDLYVSTSGGTSWSEKSLIRKWSSCATSYSNNALYMFAAIAVTSTIPQTGQIYRSTDSGNGWSLTNAQDYGWQDLTCNSTGQYVFACSYRGGIYKSQDFGLNWENTNAPAGLQYKNIACSSDGVKIVVVVYGGGIYISNNSGANWQLSDANTRNYTGVACSSDRTQMVAVAYGDNAYLSTTTTAAPTNFFTVQNSGVNDLSKVFAPLTTTSAVPTKFLVENYNGSGVTKDLNQIFEALPVGTVSPAQATNFLVENYNGSGVTKDLNQIFKPL